MGLRMRGVRATWGVWASSLVLLIVSTVARTGVAQDARQTALARTLFEEGVSAADHGDWVGAADRFGRAYTLKPTPGIAFNWASALIRTGKLVQAQELLLAIGRDPHADPSLKEESSSLLTTVTPRMARLRVHVAAPYPESQVEVDGSDWPRAAWDVASPIDPGIHAVLLKRGVVEHARMEVKLGEGDTRDVAFDAQKTEQPALAPTPDTPPVRTDTSARRPLYKTWWLWTAVGGLIVGGVVIGALAARDKGDRNEPPVTGNATPGVLRW